ncbi:MAG TPA: hypothetical protein VII24_00570 [Pseudolabrys sp.]|jgi:hypothetical protein
MTKGYPIGLPLQTKLVAKVHSTTVILKKPIVAKSPFCTDYIHPMLTMNSVAQHAFPD